MSRPIDAAVARGDGGFSIETLTLDDPGPGEVLVRYTATGLCHTDLDVAAGKLPTPRPVVAGHEGVGVVEAVGPGVTSVVPGRRVLLSIDSCGDCTYCRGGHLQYCVEHVPRNFLAQRADGTVGLRDRDGGAVHDHFFGQSSFATHGLAAERSVIEVDADIDDIDDTALAPLACGVITGFGAVTASLRVRPGSTVAVLGAGTVGLSAIMAARAAGAARIVAVDAVKERLALASELGATDVLEGGADVGAALVDLVDDVGVDYAVESSGAPALMAAAVQALAPLGEAVVLGFASMTEQIPVGAFGLLQGRVVRGAVMGHRSPADLVAEALRAHADGQLPVERLISTYPLADISVAVEDVHAGRAVKAVLRPDA